MGLTQYIIPRLSKKGNRYLLLFYFFKKTKATASIAYIYFIPFYRSCKRKKINVF